MSMTQEQAAKLSSILGLMCISYSKDDCPSNVRFMDFCKTEFEYHLQEMDDELKRLMSIKPFTKKRSEHASGVRLRRDTFYGRVSKFVNGLKFEHDQMYLDLMNYGYRPSKTGTQFGNIKVKFVSPPTMNCHNTWVIAVETLPNMVNYRLAGIDNIVLDGLETALLCGTDAPSIEMLTKDECEVIAVNDVPLVNGIPWSDKYRSFTVRKLYSAKEPHRWRAGDWVKAGWMYTRRLECTK